MITNEATGKEIRETAFNTHQGSETATIFSEQEKWVNKILKYAESHPDEVKVETRNADGSIVATVPVKWMKLSPPRKMSEEQIEAARQRMIAMRKTSKST